MRNGVVLIPALNPPKELLEYIRGLIAEGFEQIIVVDDGSSQPFEYIFDTIRDWKECTVLKHALNLGKGRALKTGFNCFLNEFHQHQGVITVDSDGQHSIKNVIDLDNALKSGNGYALYLGCRNFNERQVPFKSKFGNKLTSGAFRILYGMKISDTQTGLRGFTISCVRDFLSLSGERFEYETNMLIEVKRKGIDLKEIPIDTIYIDQNSGTHFNPIRDSIRIYQLILKEFFRFSIISIGSFVIDIGLFRTLLNLFVSYTLRTQIFAATIGARIISSLFNCLMNKSFVFESKAPVKKFFLRYYMLCAVQMFCSALLVYAVTGMVPISKTIIKICIDSILFFISFRIQKNFIYN